MLKAVLFDLDGTLNTSRAYARAFEQTYLDIVSEKLQVDRNEARRRVEALKRRLLSLTMSIERLGLPRTVFYDEVARRLPVDKVVTRRHRLASLFAALKRRRLRVGIVTNSGRPLALKTITALGLPQGMLDVLVTSSEAPPKPSLEPYLYATRSLGIRPSEALYIGDRELQELKPAREAGMRTVLLAEDRTSHQARYADWTVRSVYDLPKLFRRITRHAPQASAAAPTGFAVWLTGIPSSGKSTIANALARRLRQDGFPVRVLETDRIRTRLFPRPTYSSRERQRVYDELLGQGKALTARGISVVIAATGYKSQLREKARRLFPRYLEAYVKCPLDVAIRRDSKGLYRLALAGKITGLPGLQERYEEPRHPDVTVDSRAMTVEQCTEAVHHAVQRAFIHRTRARRVRQPVLT